MDELSKLTYKVARDPIHSEIKLYPLELMFVDTPLLQRLRGLSQLCGAQLAYPGATHTRFAHSLGAMHIAGMYAQNIWRDDPGKVTLIRLAALLHDVGHGPFSHQFDESIYKLTRYVDHDGYRLKLLREVAPELLMDSIKMSPEPLREEALTQLSWITGSDELNSSNLKALVEAIIEVYDGEREGTPEFNVTQGVLGADRLDFLLRDSFYSGTAHFGGAPVDRLTRNSMVLEGKLCYSRKVMDDIYSVLFTRFMMYKNVYFHKLGRAADMMVQEILALSRRYVDYDSILDFPMEFLRLTDARLLTLIELRAEEADDQKLLKLIEAYRGRKVWKLFAEIPFYMEGVDPIAYVHAFKEETIRHLRLTAQELLDGDELSEADRALLETVIAEPEEHIKVDVPFRLTLVEPSEFMDTNVYIYDDTVDKVLSFEEFLSTWPAYRLFRQGPVQLIRIYVTDVRLRELLRPLRRQLYDKLRGRAVTRW